MIPQPVSDVPMGSSEDVLASAMRQRRDQLQKLARSARLQQPVRCLVRWGLIPLTKRSCAKCWPRKPTFS